ncbi:low affinity immunoglobulin epsilon Fc receptor-like [Saccostrea echinata]|uniref:low affinity immunoglobulin epsilon Fc receptor-like n=1 Tax=Saccostrea echinata TaxID=191078 RepID=UPI002A834924|nr:low affinity immunoglobulin epsilon Fc receptor-like [Saccostrea echinata]
MELYFVLLIVISCGPCVIAGCKTGWIQFQSKCYHFSTLGRDWGVASSYCEAFNSKLAEPQTEAEAHFLSSHAQKFPGKSFWLGITDMVEETTWIYASNQAPIGVSSMWGPSEPNGHAVENCAMLYAGTHDKMADYGCNGALNFICEQDYEFNPEIVVG